MKQKTILCCLVSKSREKTPGIIAIWCVKMKLIATIGLNSREASWSIYQKPINTKEKGYEKCKTKSKAFMITLAFSLNLSKSHLQIKVISWYYEENEIRRHKCVENWALEEAC